MDLCHSATGGMGGGQKELINFFLLLLFLLLTTPMHIVSFAGFIQDPSSIKKG